MTTVGQAVQTATIEDETPVNFVVVGGRILRVGTDLATTEDVTPGNITIDASARVYLTPFSNRIAVNDGVNTPWVASDLLASPISATTIQYESDGSAWLASGPFVVWQGTLFIIVRSRNSEGANAGTPEQRLMRIAWSEVDDPLTGYHQTDFDNEWDIVQNGDTAINALVGTNNALIYLRDGSVGYLTGSLDDLKTTSTHDAISENVGTRSPATIQSFGSGIFFADVDGRVMRIQGAELSDLWPQMRRVVDAAQTRFPDVTARTACAVIVPELDIYLVALWSPDPTNVETVFPTTMYTFRASTGVYGGRWSIGPLDGDKLAIHAMGTLVGPNGEPRLCIIGKPSLAASIEAPGLYMLDTLDATQWHDDDQLPDVFVTTNRIGYSAGAITNAHMGTAIVNAVSDVSTAPDLVPFSIIVSPSSFSLAHGETRQLTAVVYNRAGGALSNVAVQWTSDNQAAVSVNAAGVATGGPAGGTAHLRAVSGAVASNTATVVNETVVVDTTPFSITIGPATVSVAAGGTQQFTATVFNKSGTVLTGVSVAWASDATGVATINGSSGLLTGGATGGTAHIHASASGVTSNAATVQNTTDVVPFSITITPASFSLAGGQTRQLTATVFNREGGILPNVTVLWASDATSIVSVSASGLATGGSTGGTAHLHATVGGVTSNASTVVNEAVVVDTVPFSITVSPSSFSLTTGGTVQLAATVFNRAGTVLSTAVSWASNTTSVASVSGSGLVTGGAVAGTARVTASASGITSNASVVQNSTVVIVDTTPFTITIAPTSFSLAKDATRQLTATVFNAAGAVLSGVTVQWLSDNDGAVSVSPTGVAIGGAIGGTAHIHAISGNVVSNAATAQNTTIVAIDTVPFAVTIAPTTVALSAGQQRQFSATVTNAAGQTLVGTVVTWHSDDTDVLIIGATGIATASTTMGGVAHITATAGSITSSASTVTVTVIGAVAFIDIAPLNAALVWDGSPRTVQLSATLRDAVGNIVPGSPTGWTSTSTAVATVSSTGLVTAFSEGNAVIHAVWSNGPITITSAPCAIASTHVGGGGGGRPLVGCPRFDDWNLANSADAGSQINLLMGNPTLYQNRWPYYVNDAIPSMDEGLQSIMDADILSASTAGINFWMFQPFSVKNRYGLNNYLASPNKSLMKFCLIQFKLLLPTSQYVTDGLNLINDPQYVKFNGRPVFFFEMFLMKGLSSPSEVASYRQMFIDAGHPNPYFVGMDLDPATTATDIDTWGLDAGSAYSGGTALLAPGLNPYSTQVSFEEAEWTTLKNGGHQLVPSVTTGYDDRWASPPTPHWTADPTPTEIANHLRNAITFVNANPTAVPSNLLVLSAWNELVENHFIVPSNVHTSAFGTSRLDAIGTVLNTIAPPPPPVAVVSVSVSIPVLSPGQTSPAFATPRDGSGNALTGRTIVWSTSGGGVASIDASSGLITALVVGTTSIIATCEGVQGTATLTVVAVVAIDPGHPNEPSGMTQLSPVLVGDVAPTLTWTPLGWVGAGITSVSDTVPGVGTTGVLQAFYPPGFVGGSAPARCWTQPTAFAQDWPSFVKTLYLSYWYKLSPGFPMNLTANKMIYAQINHSNSGGLMLQASGAEGTTYTAPVHPQIGLQNILSANGVAVTAQLYPNYGVTMQRGEWFHVEGIFVANTAGAADGSASMFINGALAVSVPNIQWDQSGAAGQFNTTFWDPVYGGGGQVPNDGIGGYHHLWDFYVSGKP